jgi:hypothetical protein
MAILFHPDCESRVVEPDNSADFKPDQLSCCWSAALSRSFTYQQAMWFHQYFTITVTANEDQYLGLCLASGTKHRADVTWL